MRILLTPIEASIGCATGEWTITKINLVSSCNERLCCCRATPVVVTASSPDEDF